MKVLIYVNYQGQEYCWDDLTEEQKQEFREKLNKQTADQLGFIWEHCKLNNQLKVRSERGIRHTVSSFHSPI